MKLWADVWFLLVSSHQPQLVTIYFKGSCRLQGKEQTQGLSATSSFLPCTPCSSYPELPAALWRYLWLCTCCTFCMMSFSSLFSWLAGMVKRRSVTGLRILPSHLPAVLWKHLCCLHVHVHDGALWGRHFTVSPTRQRASWGRKSSHPWIPRIYAVPGAK